VKDVADGNRLQSGATGKGTAPRVSVLVRARNDEALIGRTLEGIFAQEGAPEFDVVVCDDGSSDRTREVAACYPVRFVEPPPGKYMPGRTLNALVRAVEGDIVVFNNSDAVPVGRDWLRELVAPLLDAPGKPRACFANQMPRADALEVVRRDHARAFGDGKVQATWRFFFSLASSATWRNLLLDAPFDETIRYSEDVEWAWRNSRREDEPVEVVYCPRARVEHSHNYTLRELGRRFRGEGASDRVIFGDRPCLVRELAGAARETLRDWAWLAGRPRGWGEIPAAPVRRLVQRIAHWRGTCGGMGEKGNA
jgi:rhamnosyltransferase